MRFECPQSDGTRNRRILEQSGWSKFEIWILLFEHFSWEKIHWIWSIWYRSTKNWQLESPNKSKPNAPRSQNHSMLLMKKKKTAKFGNSSWNSNVKLELFKQPAKEPNSKSFSMNIVMPCGKSKTNLKNARKNLHWNKSRKFNLHWQISLVCCVLKWSFLDNTRLYKSFTITIIKIDWISTYRCVAKALKEAVVSFGPFFRGLGEVSYNSI